MFSSAPRCCHIRRQGPFQSVLIAQNSCSSLFLWFGPWRPFVLYASTRLPGQQDLLARVDQVRISNLGIQLFDAAQDITVEATQFVDRNGAKRLHGAESDFDGPMC